MNSDMFKGKWHQIKGKIKEKWGKLTDNDIHEINGRREQFLGKLQERYGWSKERAQEEFNRWADSYIKMYNNKEKYEEEYFREEGEKRFGRKDEEDRGEDFPRRKAR